MVPDRLQYFLDDYWNFDNFVKILTRRPPNYYPNAFTNARKYGNILDNITFVNMGTTQFEKK